MNNRTVDIENKDQFAGKSRFGETGAAQADDSFLDSHYYSKDEVAVDASDQRHYKLVKILLICSSLVIGSNLLLMPFLFGGVHENSYLSFRSAIFTLLALIVLLDFSSLSSVLSPSSRQGRAFLALSGIFVLVCLHALVFQLLKSPHPVLGSVSRLLNPTAAINFILEFAYFLSLYAIALYWLGVKDAEKNKSSSSTLTNIILVSGLLVSFTALSHWFYDNGKLFWTFSPNFEGTSSRARWPFVNSNHLGIFLIIPLFIAVGRIQQSWLSLKKSTQELNRRGKLILSDVLTSQESQIHSRSLILMSLTILCFALALVASLSRNANFAAFTCLLLLYLFPGNKVTKPIPVKGRDETLNLSVSSSSEPSSGSRTRRRSNRRHTQDRNFDNKSSLDISAAIPFLRFMWRLALVVSAIAIFSYFLGEKGGALFKSRVEYALLYTQDDMRWQLYSDSVPMLLANLSWGIGLGNWSVLYPRFMAAGLSGMEPGYLHSDLLQTAIEIGALGSILFVISSFYIGIQLYKGSIYKISRGSINSAVFSSRAAFFGFLALIMSASFEFPFRIPAITAIFAISLALALYQTKSKAGL